MILWDNGRIFTRSDAALHIAGRLQEPWRWLAVLRFVPRSLRNWVYDRVSRHRYQWFGKKESCWLPTPTLKALFLD
jgi:predicted DCC family thiol-disulfide oxidoreductase YuxK